LLARIKAPDPGEQALTPEHLVAAGDAAFEIIHHVKEGRIAVGDTRIETKEIEIDRSGLDSAMDAVEEIDCCLHPHAPVAEQPALDPD
jgi:hypothetical protein